MAGLGGGIGFMYAVFEYQGWPPIVTIVAQHHPEPWLPAMLGRLGVGYTQEHSSAPKPALAALRHALVGGRPAYCTTDMTALPWHAGQPSYSEVPYEVVVAGRHDRALHLDDSSVVPLAMPEEEFVRAWGRHKKGRHHRIVLAPAAVPVDLRAAVRDAIATTVAHLTGPVLGHSFDSNFGFSGMTKLATQLRDARTKTGWARRFGSQCPSFTGYGASTNAWNSSSPRQGRPARCTRISWTRRDHSLARRCWARPPRCCGSRARRGRGWRRGPPKRRPAWAPTPSCARSGCCFC